MEVIWTPLAKEHAYEILKYAQLIFGKKTSQKLAKEMLANDIRLSDNPYIGSVETLLESQTESFRSLMINKIFKEVYFVSGNTIYIVALWNCNQNPNRMQDLLL